MPSASPTNSPIVASPNTAPMMAPPSVPSAIGIPPALGLCDGLFIADLCHTRRAGATASRSSRPGTRDRPGSAPPEKR